MSGTVCCYSGCKKSYSTDKDISFFKFPDEPKRRKKWLKNCGNLELEDLPERRLRGKRICADHFTSNSFLNPESKTALNDNAVPVLAKKTATTPAPGSASPAAAVATPPKRAKAAAAAKAAPTPPPPKAKSPVNKQVKPAAAAASSPVPAVVEEKPEVKPVTPENDNKASVPTPAKRTAPAAASPTVPAKRGKLAAAAKAAATPPPTKAKSAQKRVTPAVIEPAAPEKPESETTTPPAAASPPKRTKIMSAKAAAAAAATPAKTKTTQKKEPKLVAAASSASPPAPVLQVAATPEKKSEPEPVKPAALDTSIAVIAKKTVVAAAASPTSAPIAKKSKAKVASPATPESPAPPKKYSRATPSSAAGKAKALKEKETPTKAPELAASASPPVLPAAPENKSEPEPVKPAALDTSIAVIAKKTVVAAAASPTATPIAKKSKAKVASPATPESPAPPKKYSRATPSSAAGKVKALKEKETPTKAPELAAQPSPALKTVSMEAMMAAVTSIKAPLVSAKEPPALASPQPAAAPPPPKVKPAQSKQKVEIVRQKPEDGSNAAAAIVLVRQSVGDESGNGSADEVESFDEYTYYDREFDFEQEEPEDAKADREFERFHVSLKKFLQLPGKWTMSGVTWDPQGKRKVIIISEAEINPSGRPMVKRCLQCFEDKTIRVFIDQMDMTDVFGMSCYAEKEDVAGLIGRIAEASSCCGVPEMVADDVMHFPDVKKRNTSYFDPKCPGVIPNDAYDPICSACKELHGLLIECRDNEKSRLLERRLRSEEKQFQHPFGEALYTLLNDLADETDPTKPKKKRTKETFFRKFLHDTRLKVNGDTARTERVYIEKPISVDSVSQSFQDIVSKLGFNMPNAKKRPPGAGMLPSRPVPMSTSTPRPSRMFGGVSGMARLNHRLPGAVEQVMPFTPGSSFTLDDGQEYELIGEVEPGQEFVEMKPAINQAGGQQQQYEIIEVDDETLARLASSGKSQVVMLPDSAAGLMGGGGLQFPTKIDANDPNLSQILKAINTSHGFKVS